MLGNLLRRRAFQVKGRVGAKALRRGIWAQTGHQHDKYSRWWIDSREDVVNVFGDQVGPAK